MARIVYGALGVIRGSVGGTTFQKNAYGYSVKNKPNMCYPNSVSQEIVKRAVLRCTQHWSDLSDADRLAWNTYASTYPQYAKFNPTARLSGYNVYLLRNINGFIFNAIPLDVPFLDPTVSSILAPTLTTADINPIEIFWNGTPAPLDLGVFIYSTAGTTSNRSIPVNSKRFLYAGEITGLNINVTANYTATFGRIPASGERVYIEFVLVGMTTGAVFASQKFILTVI
jgi:hypothetical protein